MGAARSWRSMPARRSGPSSSVVASAVQRSTKGEEPDEAYSPSLTDVEPVLTTRTVRSGIPVPVADVGEVLPDGPDVAAVADELVGH